MADKPQHWWESDHRTDATELIMSWWEWGHDPGADQMCRDAMNGDPDALDMVMDQLNSRLDEAP